MIDHGSGSPLVLIPGIQGRWEWMKPAVEALSARMRVISGSLCGEPNSEVRLLASMRFDAHVTLLDHWLERAGVERATLCGISYGGWVALRYAARRPDRVQGLVFASSPGPRFVPDARQQRYLRTPTLSLPMFILSSPERMRREMAAALPDAHERFRFMHTQLRRMAGAPVSPWLMARRMRVALREDFITDARAVSHRTLVITGERGLDRVVPVESTLEYARWIPHAHVQTLARTGHMGCVTRPDAFASLVSDFVSGARERDETRRNGLDDRAGLPRPPRSGSTFHAD